MCLLGLARGEDAEFGFFFGFGWGWVLGFGDGDAGGDVEHALEGDFGPVFGGGVDGDLVDDFALGEVVQRIEEVWGIDAVHGGAEALAVGEDGDGFVGVGFGEAVDHVDFGADGPLGAWGSGGDGFADEVGAAGEVGFLDDFVAAFGVDQDGDAGDLGTDHIDVFGSEELVDGAVSFPEDEGGVADLVIGEAAGGLFVVPDDHGVEGEAHFGGGVSAEVLVGEEDNFGGGLPIAYFRLPIGRGGAGALGEGPGEDFFAVGGGADGAAVFAYEGFDGGGGVHVGDGDEGEVGDGLAGLGDDGVGVLDVVELGHVGHGASGAEVWEEDLLVVGGEDVGGFGHEVYAAEDDVLGFGEFGGFAGELEGVAGDVGEADDVVLLVVVAEDDEFVA